MMTNQIIQGNSLEVLRGLPAESVDMCVTSPPYFGLRSNPCEPITWGGKSNCKHIWGNKQPFAGQVAGNKKPSNGFQQRAKSALQSPQYAQKKPTAGQFCLKCGAWLGQLGLEPTPELYVEHLTAIFTQVRRVLKPTGTLWLNLGDSYSSGGRKTSTKGTNIRARVPLDYRPPQPANCKPKDLVGIPWMVAFALRAPDYKCKGCGQQRHSSLWGAWPNGRHICPQCLKSKGVEAIDGWYLRQDIIWCLSGGADIYAKGQKGPQPMTIKDLARLAPGSVQLWTGRRWTNFLGASKSKRIGNELELVLRSGERIGCTPSHKFPTSRGLLEAKDIIIGDSLIQCRLPDTNSPKDCAIGYDAAWFAGLYLAEGSHSEDTIQISGHIKEEGRWERLCEITKMYGGAITQTINGNCMDIRLYGKVLNAIIAEFVGGKTAKDKHFAPVVWRYSNDFVKSMLFGYLSGDGHWDEANNRWRLGFTRNDYLARDIRTACARLNYHLVLNPSYVVYNNKRVPTYRGELRIRRSGHLNQKDSAEVVQINKARCRNVYDIGVEDSTHLFSLASGILTHNSKPNPMPESIRDRCTRSHEYIFLLSKSKKYYYDNEAIKEPCVNEESIKGRRFRGRKAILTSGQIPNGLDGIHNTSKIEVGKVYLKRNKRDVWTVTVKSVRGSGHFSTYPVDLIEPCVLAGCPRGGVVLDPFMGSGTTAIASLKNGRRYLGIEASPKFVASAEKRIRKFKIEQTKNKK